MAYTPKKISQFTPAVSLTGNEFIPFALAGVNGYTTPNQIKALFAGHYYPEVTAYADLPAANLHATELYVVLTSTGVWLISRKDAGLYYSNGASWVRLGDIPSYFSSANFQIYDGTNNSKVAKFDLTGITASTTRTYVLPDGDGTLALTSHNHSGVYEVPLTFGSGLTRTLNAVTNDLITGKAGGQTMYGGLAQTEALYIKGNIATASGTNIAGGDIYINAVPGTGTGASSIRFFTGTTLTTGSTLQTSSEKMTILGSGCIGIGSTNPTAQLEVVKTIGTNNIATFFGNGGNTIIDQWGNFYTQGLNPTAGIVGTGVVSFRIANTEINGKDWRWEQYRYSSVGSLELNLPVSSLNAITVLSTGKIGIGLTNPNAALHIKAGSDVANGDPFKLTSGELTTGANMSAGAFGFLNDDLYFTITTGTARKGIILNDGSNLTSGRLAVATTNGRLTNAPDLSGSGDRIVQANTSGVISATVAVVTGKLSDGTAIALLVDTANWTLGLYTGTAITGTYEGQYYKNDDYFFTAYSDNDWIRIPRA